MHLALRQLSKSPGFTFTALTTLALCLGANLTIFAVVDAVLLRGLPFPESERLVAVVNRYPGAGVDRAGASVPNYFDRRHAIPTLASISSFQTNSVIVGGTSTPHRTPTARVTPEFFQTLGVPLALGQPFTDEHLLYSTDQVAILTDEFWRAQFQADPAIVGQTFLNDGLTITIRGVLPAGFKFLNGDAMFFRPLSHAAEDRDIRNRHSNNSQMIARLAPGATLAEAQAQLDALNAQQLQDEPFADLIRNAGYQTSVRPLHDDYVRDVKDILVVLQIGVGFLLLIGTVNLANLLLIRASSRVKELAVRQALGAGRRHIARDVLTETLLLALAGGALGLLLGASGIQLLKVLGTDQLPLGTMITFDGRVAAMALAAAVLVGVLLALPIIWFNLRSRLAPVLQAETRGGTTSRGAQLLRYILIVAQVTLAFVLLAGAGLLGVSLKRLLDTPTGFNPANILTGQLALPWKSYPDEEKRLAFVERLLPAIRALPGVTHVALNTGLPFSGNGSNGAVAIEGRTTQPGDSVRAHYMNGVSSEYWSLMGIPLLRGRFLEDADNQREQRVCVVDEAFAERYWPGENPIGRRIVTGPEFVEDRATTIVGVVANAKQSGLAEESGYGAVYMPYRIFNSSFFSLLVRTSMAPETFGPTLQKGIFQLDPELPIDDLRSMEARIDDSLLVRRSPAILGAIFAVVALLLAAVGTYGVLAYAVAQRRREIGVRMALGALPRQVLTHFLRIGALLLAIGVGIGLLGAWLAGRAMQSLLFQVTPLHAGVLAATAVVMLIVVLLATLLPARRAARVNPVEALRAE